VRNALAPPPCATHRNVAFKEAPSRSASCDTQHLCGFPLTRYSAQIGGEQKTNRENKVNIDGGQRMEREDGSQWYQFELGCDLLLIFFLNDAN